MVSETAPGLEPRKWIYLLLLCQEKQGLFQDPAFVDNQGEVSSGKYEALIMGCSKTTSIGKRNRKMSLKAFSHLLTLLKYMGSHAPFKEGASQGRRKLEGLWRVVEWATSRKPSQSMCEHHMELVQMLDIRLHFSKAL
jgi:hypothetical protein